MLLHDLLDAIDVLEVLHDAPVAVSDVTHDSRSVRPGAVFCCVPGDAVDGHDFAAVAVRSGAVALVVERTLAPAVPQARVRSVREVMGPIASRVHGDPSRHIPVVGVTGTNGKTTVTYMLEAIFAAAAMRAALIGTTGVRFDGRAVPATFTTPEAPELQRTLAGLRRQGADIVAIEVSSHALAEHRVDGTRFAVVCLTNLTHDHLDYHGTVAEYAAAKARLFTAEFSDVAAVNVDDPFGRDVASAARDEGLEVVTYGLGPQADPEVSSALPMVHATNLQGDGSGTEFLLHLPDRVREVHLSLPGRFNVMNALAATAAATTLGIDDAIIASGLSRMATVPGRFETVGSGSPILVIVDYAHTPDGLDTVLAAVRALGRGRVIAVFGCGGDRDTEKRPLMGAVAGRGADFVVLTNDNPRSEDPEAIAAAVTIGLRDGNASFETQLDRRLAIRAALQRAEPGDTVLILGKGAETVQEIGSSRRDFDDRRVAAEELRLRNTDTP